MDESKKGQNNESNRNSFCWLLSAIYRTAFTSIHIASGLTTFVLPILNKHSFLITYKKVLTKSCQPNFSRTFAKNFLLQFSNSGPVFFNNFDVLTI
jgi:hypothetical protein